MVKLDKRNENRKPFVGVVHIFSDNTMTMLNSTALIAYPVHTILLNVSLRRLPRMIDKGHKLVRFSRMYCSKEEMKEEGGSESDDISVYRFTSSTTVPPERRVRTTEDLEGRKMDDGSALRYERRSETDAGMGGKRVSEVKPWGDGVSRNTPRYSRNTRNDKGMSAV